MRQLLALMGDERFGRGCGNYFKKFAFNNATLKDFIEELDKEFSKSNNDFTLHEW